MAVTLPVVKASAAPALSEALPQKPLVWSGKNGNVDAPVAGVFGLGRELFAIGPRALRRSSDGGAHWAVNRDAGGYAMWGASMDELWIATDGALRSRDRGATWTRMNVPYTKRFEAVGGRSGDVILGGIDALYRSTDHGATWTAVRHGVPLGTFIAVAASGADVFVVGREQVTDPSSSIGYHTESIILRSTNGASFVRLTAPVPHMTSNEESRGVCFTSSGTMFVAMSYAVYASADRGVTWRRAVDVGTEVLGLACHHREVMIAARNKRFLRSNDDGATFDDHDLEPLLGPELVALTSVWIGADGTALVTAEATAGTGTLLQRSR